MSGNKSAEWSRFGPLFAAEFKKSRQILILGDEEIGILQNFYTDFPRTMVEADFVRLPAFKKHAQLFSGGHYKGQTGLKTRSTNGHVSSVTDFRFLNEYGDKGRCTFIQK